MWSPDLYQRAILFAARAHLGQRIPGSEIPYVVHLSNVAMEVLTALSQSPDKSINADLALQCALLHDSIEDAGITYENLVEDFGVAIADGVQALTKDESIAGRREQMTDSLRRIRRQPPEIAMVKLADRITNLQPPPAYWKPEKIRYYREEARLILGELGGTNAWLERRLAEKIVAYGPSIE